MIRKANDYRRDYKGYLQDAEITDSLKVGKDKEGGFLVPDEMEDKIVEALKEHNVIRKVANVITTEKALNLVCGDDKPQGIWVDEGENFTFSDMSFYNVVIDAHKNGCLIRVTDELVEDSGFDIENYIIKSVGESIGSLEEAAFLTGDGNSKPRGVLVDAQVGVETKELTADVVVDLYSSLESPYRENGVWVMSDDAEEQIRKIKNYGGRPIWEPDHYSFLIL